MQEQMTQKRNTTIQWKAWLILVIASQLAGLLSIPYGIYLATQLTQPLWFFILSQMLDLLFFGGVVALGMWLGNKVGLGVPLLEEWTSGKPEASRRFLQVLPRTLLIGLIVSILLIAQLLITQFLLLRVQAPTSGRAIMGPPPWQGFLSAFGGGIREELLFRLACMTLFVWLAVLLLRQKTPSSGVVWMAIILSSLIFALAHLSQALAVGSTVAIIVVTASVIGNCILGVSCGWLYWRYSLLAAIVVHFLADIATHTIAPILLNMLR